MLKIRIGKFTIRPLQLAAALGGLAVAIVAPPLAPALVALGVKAAVLTKIAGGLVAAVAVMKPAVELAKAAGATVDDEDEIVDESRADAAAP